MKIASEQDRSGITKILSDSFKANRSVLAVCNNDPDRIPMLMHYSFDVCMEFGKVFISDDSKSCLLMLRPKAKRNSLKSIFRDLRLIRNVIGFSNIFKVLGRESLVKRIHPKDDFLHLWYIGVDPNHTGKGIGSELLGDVIAYYKNKGMPIYLETSTVKNFSFYKKNGFKKVAEIEDPLPYKLTVFKNE